MSEEKKEEEEPKKITDEEKENMCALEYNINKKGENAYYYTHKSRF